MRKSLENKIKKYVGSTKFPFAVYYTESPFNFNRYDGYKYFFCYHNTHNIANAFKNQRDLEQFVNEELSNIEE